MVSPALEPIVDSTIVSIVLCSDNIKWLKRQVKQILFTSYKNSTKAVLSNALLSYREESINNVKYTLLNFIFIIKCYVCLCRIVGINDFDYLMLATMNHNFFFDFEWQNRYSNVIHVCYVGDSWFLTSLGCVGYTRRNVDTGGYNDAEGVFWKKYDGSSSCVRCRKHLICPKICLLLSPQVLFSVVSQNFYYFGFSQNILFCI
jgi:hypothetical protein